MKILKITLILLLTYTLYADKVEITSTSMRAENLKKEVHFIGNAKVKKLDDWLHADKIIVYFDDNNETKMYEAIGSVTFEFKNEKNNYTGSADKITYHPLTSVYVLEGKAWIDDMVTKRHVNGDKVTLDMTSGDVQVSGSAKKPVKFIFDMEEKK